MNNLTKFEEDSVKLIKSILDSWHKDFPDLGLRETIIGPKHYPSDIQPIEESELEIRFFDDSRLVDVLEFHLYRNGKQTVSLSEIEVWLRENLICVAEEWKKTQDSK